MKGIARRAGATRQTLYARFANKTVLYKALVQARTSELLSLLSLALDDQAPPQSALEQFACRLLSAFVSSDLQRLHRMVISEASRFPRLAGTFYELGTERGKQLLMQYLEAQVKKGTLHIRQADVAAEQFIGSLVGAVVIRSTLSQKQLLSDIHKQKAWVKTAVKVFLSAYEQS